MTTATQSERLFDEVPPDTFGDPAHMLRSTMPTTHVNLRHVGSGKWLVIESAEKTRLLLLLGEEGRDGRACHLWVLSADHVHEVADDTLVEGTLPRGLWLSSRLPSSAVVTVGQSLTLEIADDNGRGELFLGEICSVGVSAETIEPSGVVSSLSP